MTKAPPRYPVIVGPTAGGKTALAVDLALASRGEVVSADSMLLYKGLDIGSAKPTLPERRGVPHHLIDIVHPTHPFTVADWLSLARKTIADIASRSHLPIVVGGTHLYVKALLDGLFEGPDPDPELRARLAALSREELRAELERIDPPSAAKLHPNDLRRTIRAIEVFRQTGRPISAHQHQWDAPPAAAPSGPSPLLVILDWPSELINRRINARVKAMLDRGLLAEARALWESNLLGPQAREALGYKQLIAHFEGRCTLDEAIEHIKIDTRRFAKSQRTWARRLRTTRGSLHIDASNTPPQRWPAIIDDALRCQT